MVVVEKLSRVSGVKREPLESGKGVKQRGSPFPSVAHELGDAEGAVSQWASRHGNRIPALSVEIALSAIGLPLPPGIGSFLFAMHCSIRGSMKLGFGRQLVFVFRWLCGLHNAEHDISTR